MKLGQRSLAAKIIQQVIDEGRSLSTLIPASLEKLPVADRALTQELVYGVLRYFLLLDWLADKLLKKPLKRKDGDLHALMLVGFYQLYYMRTPEHAAVSETVRGCLQLGKGWAKGLLNGVLRNAVRQQDALLAELEADQQVISTLHPEWLLEELKKAWPEQWQQIVFANNQRPPMTLRVNQQHGSRETYLQRLAAVDIAAHAAKYSDVAINLESPVRVEKLPGFADGDLSVQDEAAQLAATLLELEEGQKVLDACAAPGGKTCHILESQQNIKLTALDRDAARLERVEENLQRLKLSAAVQAGDAGHPGEWWDGEQFDRILLDAPCSAIGVVRRHPDIKLLRDPADIEALVKEQEKILDACWPLLKPGGIMVYATCSILPQENSQQVEKFLARTDDASEKNIDQPWGHTCQAGRQLFPGEDGMDGFYYAVLQKSGR